MAIDINGLTCRRETAVLLRDISLRIEAGAFTVIVGPNGAGKSSLLRILSGEWKASAGSIFWGKRPLEEWEAHEIALCRGVLPQESRLHFPFTVREVVLLGRTPHITGRETKIDRSIADHALAATDLLGLEHRIYTTLSGGEKQRVQFARVLAQILTPPEGIDPWLLLDEPVSNLDPLHAFSILQEARKQADNGAGVIAILHDLNLAARYADEIIFLKQGRVHCKGSPDAILTAQVIREVFEVEATITADSSRTRYVILAPPNL